MTKYNVLNKLVGFFMALTIMAIFNLPIKSHYGTIFGLAFITSVLEGYVESRQNNDK